MKKDKPQKNFRQFKFFAFSNWPQGHWPMAIDHIGGPIGPESKECLATSRQKEVPSNFSLQKMWSSQKGRQMLQFATHRASDPKVSVATFPGGIWMFLLFTTLSEKWEIPVSFLILAPASH